MVKCIEYLTNRRQYAVSPVACNNHLVHESFFGHAADSQLRRTKGDDGLSFSDIRVVAFTKMLTPESTHNSLLNRLSACIIMILRRAVRR